MKTMFAAALFVVLSSLLGATEVAVIGQNPEVRPVLTEVERVQSPTIGSRESTIGTDAIMIPRILSYQGKLTDELGNPVADTTYNVTFRLYTQPTGGSAFWNETQTVRTKSGLFSALLGSVTPIGSMPDAGAAYLGMAVMGGPELTPRLRLASAAYSFLAERAANADALQGKDTTALDGRFVNESQTNSVTSAMIVDGTIVRADVAAGFRAPLADTADYARAAPAADSARVAANSHRLQGKDTTALDGRFVNESQTNSVTSAMIVDGTIAAVDIATGAVTTVKLADTAVTMAKIARAGASTGQVLKWTDTGWQPRNDSVGGDNAWVRGTPDSVLYTVRNLGVARGEASNMLYGSYRFTHVNLGVACTTGTSGQDRSYATVGGGWYNVASGNYTAVAGGCRGVASANYATVGGGCGNVASGNYTAVAGGYQGVASANYATVGGGYADTASGSYATVAGGRINTASSHCATVAGGSTNTASDDFATVGGGSHNTASGSYASVGGGSANTASGRCATVAGGSTNTASDDFATVGGGYQNTASEGSATVAGGYMNTASGQFATVAGGYLDSACGDYSFAVGMRSMVPSSFYNAAALNGQTATASTQTRVGVLSKASGTFTIDHPLDPYGKILNHYFIEGPEMRNIYDGEAVLDGSGRAVVTLPDYFEALNRKPRVQVTGVGTSDVYVAQEVNGNRFVIGGRPGTRVFWQVTGERKDVSAEATRRMMPVEQPKTGELAVRMLDDEFLSGCMGQLEREGKAQGIEFRTAAGRQRYQEMIRATQDKGGSQ